MRNKIFNEDFKKTFERKDINFNYVFTVPPDFDELGWHPEKDMEKYITFLYDILELLQKKCNLITIAITDRKFNKGVVSKHVWITNLMIQGFKYKLISHKIWHKSPKRNLYRLNYTHIMTFGKGQIKQNHPQEYEYDIYTDKSDAYKGYSYSIPVSVVCKLIENFTQLGDIIYDSFMGSGTTAIAALKKDRNYIGSEINESYYHLANQRITEYYSGQHRWW